MHPTYQAYTAGIRALQHGPNNAKAWLRVADACKVAGRWQLTHLLYSTTVDELGLRDDAVQVRLQADECLRCGPCEWLAQQAMHEVGASIRQCPCLDHPAGSRKVCCAKPADDTYLYERPEQQRQVLSY